MKIGFVLSSTPANSETFFIAKIKGLQEMGHQVLLFANQNRDFNLCQLITHPKVGQNLFIQVVRMIISYLEMFLFRPFKSICYLRLDKGDGIPFRTRWENLYLSNHIIKERLDWLHFGFAAMAYRRENVAQCIGAKMGVSLRGYDICLYPLKYPGCYLHLWSKVDKVHSISNALLKIAKKHGLTNTTPQIVIQPAINGDYFNQGKKKWEMSNDNKKKIHFLTVARLQWVKGLEYTLQALAILNEKNIPFYYTVIGEGHERERLIFAVHQMGLDNRVSFAGSSPHYDIKKHYKKADIYLQYSIQEGFCNAVLEAQAMRLLTIVSDADGLPENVINNETGWVVPKRNPALLSKKIMEVINLTATDKMEISSNARKRVLREFKIDNQNKLFNSFFNNKND